MTPRYWSLWFGIVAGVVLAFGLFGLMITELNASDQMVTDLGGPVLFLGGVLGGLAIHARNRAKRAHALRPRGYRSPAKTALTVWALGFVLYLLSLVGSLPLAPNQTFNTFVLGGASVGAAIAWIRNRFVRKSVSVKNVWP